MGATPIWRMSISQENKDVNAIIEEWTNTSGRDASNKACKAIREYYKQEQLKKQIIQQGGAGNATEQFIQTAEFDNGFASPLDNLPIPNLNEVVELTEAHLNSLNDEQAIELANQMKKGKDIWINNQRFVWDFFDISEVYDSSKGEKVLTIKNSEYERKRKEQEREAMQIRQEQERKRKIAEQEELERIKAQEREADSNKTLEQLASETVQLIKDNHVTGNNQIVAIKLGISIPEVNQLSHSTYT